MRFVTSGQSNIKKAYLEEVAKAAFSVLGDKDSEQSSWLLYQASECAN